jgi:hypothetical protein
VYLRSTSLAIADGVGGVMQSAVVARRWEEEPDKRKVEGEGKGEDLVGIEFAVALAFVGTFDGGDPSDMQSRCSRCENNMEIA